MKGAADTARVRRLLRWYPGTWRRRYGAEFSELLLADLAERPRCARRTADIAFSGMRARLAGAGLAGFPVDPEAAARAGLGTLACSIAAFAIVGSAMWSQLAIGVQWAVPDNRGITQALDLMSAALLLLLVPTVMAAVAIAVAAIRACLRA